MLRRIAYSLPLRLMYRFALSLILLGLLSTSSALLSACRASLIASRFALLLLKLARMTLIITVSPRSFGVEPVFLLASLLFLLGTLVYLLRRLLLIPGIPELLVSGPVGNAFHAHRLGQVLPKPRIPNFPAGKNRRVPEFPGNAGRQVDLAASPCRAGYCVSKRCQRQRIER